MHLLKLRLPGTPHIHILYIVSTQGSCFHPKVLTHFYYSPPISCQE